MRLSLHVQPKKQFYSHPVWKARIYLKAGTHWALLPCWQSGDQLGKQWSQTERENKSLNSRRRLILFCCNWSLNILWVTNWARNSKQWASVLLLGANSLVTFLPLNSKPKAHWAQGLRSSSPGNTCHRQPWYLKTQGKSPCSPAVFASPASRKIGSSLLLQYIETSTARK